MATVTLTPEYGEDRSPRNLNMWVLKQFTDSLKLEVEYCKRLYSGQILFKFSPQQNHHSWNRLFNTAAIGGVPVRVAMPEHLNVVKGIIYHRELQYMTAKEVQEMMAAEGVATAQKPDEAPYAILAWRKSVRTEVPATVLIGWDRVRVKPCTPRPRRCYCCQQYGHTAVACNKTPVCSHCGEEHEFDEDSGCPNDPKCAACGGPHAATDPSCMIWQEEKAVAKLRHEKKLSYSEAVRQRKAKKKEEEEPPEKTAEQEESDNEDDTEDSEEDQQGEEEEPRTNTKRKKEGQEEESEDSSAEAQLPPTGRRPIVQSVAKTDAPGDWRKVTSRRKRK